MRLDSNFRLNLGGSYKLWYFEDEALLTSKINITECGTGGFTHKTTTPCWNNTLNATVRVYVPHFSIVTLVNDTRPPTVSINKPENTYLVLVMGKQL